LRIGFPDSLLDALIHNFVNMTNAVIKFELSRGYAVNFSRITIQERENTDKYEQEIFHLHVWG
jgi:hypothetical protein